VGGVGTGLGSNAAGQGLLHGILQAQQALPLQVWLLLLGILLLAQGVGWLHE
jgi:hypothetical protein